MLGSLPEQIAEQLADRLGAERRERELLVVGLLHPLGVVLGAEVHEQQRARLPAIASTTCARNASLAASIQCRSSISDDRRLAPPRACDARRRSTREELALARLRVHARRRAAAGRATPRKSKSSGSASRKLSSSSSRRPAIFSRARAVVVLLA